MQTPYDPYLQRDKQRALSRRALWTVGDARDGGEVSGKREDVQGLLAELGTFEAAEAAAQKGRRGKRDYIEDWQRVLRESRSRSSSRAGL